MKDYLNPEDKVAGHLNGDIYTSHRGPQHVMRKFGPAFGLSDSILEDIKKNGCKTIEIIYHGANGKKRYTCPIQLFLLSPVKAKFTDLQTFVAIRDFKEEDL